ncbi:YCF48-related protein [Pseudomonas sp. LS44]|uniref:WD40/YVTN/BNR-like repeat-containing protein n=1 Tax=Pseudomonas sp. LS44 TaxID=1357074 RepID=UPI00215B7568|nr:YCF48-related protein [Pseudomonas sp. LS44]UVE17411.1 YCF48-related protein [Pseudomonas sp. LS44]
MRSLIAYLVCAIVAAGIAYAFTPRDPQTPSDTQLRADRVHINALLNLDKRQVAVGERGSILLSDDQGRSWQQASVKPQRHVSLTGLVAVSAEQLLAVGHDGLILRSQDAGSTWQEVRFEAEQGEPLLGIWAAGGNRVLAFGSFGKFYQSDDAGLTWQTLPLEVDSAHLNSMDGGADGRRMLVGEQGLVLRSSDAGQNWQTLPPFYKGSLFGVVRLSAQRWVTYGMRGHVFVSDNFGDSWEEIKVGNKLPLYGHVLLPNNSGVLIVGAGSSLVRLDGRGRLLETSRQPGLGTLTSAIVVGAQQVLVGGERGVFQGPGVSVVALGK